MASMQESSSNDVLSDSLSELSSNEEEPTPAVPLLERLKAPKTYELGRKRKVFCPSSGSYALKDPKV